MESESKQGPSLPEEVQAEPSTEGATDWKAEARKWERRSKENADKVRAYDELQEQSKSEIQKAKEEAAAYKRQVEDLSAKAELDRARARVAKDTGAPAELVFGADEDEMAASAKAIAAWGKPSSAPRTSRPGRFFANAGDGRDAARRPPASCSDPESSKRSVNEDWRGQWPQRTHPRSSCPSRSHRTSCARRRTTPPSRRSRRATRRS